MAEAKPSTFIGDSQNLFLPTHPLFDNLIGRRFGRLLVQKYAGRIGKKRISAWQCLCDCGKQVVVAATALKGKTQSCGCLHRENAAQLHTHNHRPPWPFKIEYQTWFRMVHRCCDETNPAYKNYGGRGIKVCERWLRSFDCFLSDMGRRPDLGYEIDRKNTNGDYEPNNCRWATRIENARNKRSNRLLTFAGKTQCISQWSEELGWPPDLISTRLQRGWTLQKTLTHAPRFLLRGPIIKGTGALDVTMEVIPE